MAWHDGTGCASAAFVIGKDARDEGSRVGFDVGMVQEGVEVVPPGTLRGEIPGAEIPRLQVAANNGLTQQHPEDTADE
jgi:hypothetical protein